MTCISRRNLAIRPGLEFYVASLFLTAAIFQPRGWSQEPGEPAATQTAIDPRQVEVRFTDDSRLKVRLADERIEVETAHGKLSIPAAEVRVIEFAQRWSDAQRQEVQAWIADLENDHDPNARQVATAALLANPLLAYTALQRAIREGTPALAERAELLVQQLREEYSAAELQMRELDMIHTDDTKVAGRILAPSIKLQTTQFGVLELKLSDARLLRSLALAEAEESDRPLDPKDALPDPGNLKAYEGQLEKVFLFKVTGGAHGSLWGTGTYTTDSNLAAAAVHAGVLKMGETGIVQVKIIASPPSFTGSTQNGLISSGYGVYGGAYEVSKPKGKRRR